MAEPATVEQLHQVINDLKLQLTEAQRQAEYLSAENLSLGENVHEHLVANIRLRTDAKLAQKQITQAIESRDTIIKALQAELQKSRTPDGPDMSQMTQDSAPPIESDNPEDVTAPASMNGKKKRKGRYAD